MLVAKLDFGRIFGRFFGPFLILFNRPPGFHVQYWMVPLVTCFQAYPGLKAAVTSFPPYLSLGLLSHFAAQYLLVHWRVEGGFPPFSASLGHCSSAWEGGTSYCSTFLSPHIWNDDVAAGSSLRALQCAF